jgi:hypothetical protein
MCYYGIQYCISIVYAIMQSLLAIMTNFIRHEIFVWGGIQKSKFDFRYERSACNSADKLI